MNFYSAAIVAAILVLVQFDAATSTMEICDKDESSLDVSTLRNMKELGPVSRASTFKKLLDRFNTPKGPNQEYLGNMYEWLFPVGPLQKIIEASTKDACSLETIKLIEEYQWQWILSTLSKSWKKAPPKTVWRNIPDPVRLFFMNFVDEIVEKCKLALPDRLQQAVGSANLDTKSIFESSFGKMIDILSVALIPSSRVKTFDDFFLLFDLIIANQKKVGHKVELEYDDDGKPVYATLQVSDPTGSQEMQRKCREEFSPIYSETVLPVMKLIDLGYGNKASELAGSRSQLIAEWYAIAQVCQLIEPIRFKASKNLMQGQVALVSGEESTGPELQDDAAASAIAKSPVVVGFEPIKMDDQLMAPTNEQVINKVKEQFKSRGKIYSRIWKNVYAAVRADMKGVMKKIFLSKKKGNNEHVLESADKAGLDDQLQEANNKITRDELEAKQEDASGSGLVRHKRGQAPRSKITTGFMILGFVSLWVGFEVYNWIRVI